MTMTRWVVMLALSVLATGCCRGKSTGGSTETTGPGIGSPVGTFKTGDAVDVEWNGAWWQGRVLSVNGGLYRVHYVGWAASWDESVTSARVRASTGSAKKGAGPS